MQLMPLPRLVVYRRRCKAEDEHLDATPFQAYMDIFIVGAGGVLARAGLEGRA